MADDEIKKLIDESLKAVDDENLINKSQTRHTEINSKSKGDIPLSNPNLTNCPDCKKEVSVRAATCPNCGCPIKKEINKQPDITEIKKDWSPGIAAVLSLIIPGAGQMYKGQVGTGIIWLLSVAVGYMLMVVPGLILHLICITNASSGNRNKGN
jgi:TM2 domain-containing membrane protein YozV